MKRFTETTKWDDPWFRRLPPEAKLFWDWICCKCDQAGVIEPDFDLAAFQTGAPITSSILSHFTGRIECMDSGKLRILKFVQFQYGKLSQTCKPHAPVFAALQKHGISPDAVEQNAAYKECVEESLRQKVISRDGMVCIYSGKELAESDIRIDHVIPRSHGGRAVMENLVVSSFEMNSIKRDYCLKTFCDIANLDLNEVLERLSKATGKAFKPYLGRVKEKEKEKEEEKETVQDKEAVQVQEREKDRQDPCTEEEAWLYAKNQPFSPPWTKQAVSKWWNTRKATSWMRSGQNPCPVTKASWRHDLSSSHSWATSEPRNGGRRGKELPESETHFNHLAPDLF